MGPIPPGSVGFPNIGGFPANFGAFQTRDLVNQIGGPAGAWGGFAGGAQGASTMLSCPG